MDPYRGTNRSRFTYSININENALEISENMHKEDL